MTRIHTLLVSYPRTYPFVNVESYVLGAVLEYVYFSATLKRYDYIAPALSSTTASDDAFSRQIPQSGMLAHVVIFSKKSYCR